MDIRKSIKGKKHWYVKCNCGAEKWYRGTYLFRKNNYHSCGSCYRQKLMLGCNKIPKRYFTSILRGAKERNLDITVTLSYIENLFIQQNKKCVYTGRDLIFAAARQRNQTTASLDRIDSSEGYIEGNVQWVHKDINMMKQKMSNIEFINTIIEIYNNTNKNDK